MKTEQLFGGGIDMALSYTLKSFERTNGFQ